MSNSRREVLIGIAGSGALLGKTEEAQHVHQHSQSQAGVNTASGTYTPKVFNAAELRSVGALVETIIPRTKTPGALDAKVHEIIDESIATNRAAQARWRKGIAEVNAMAQKAYRKSYADLEAGDQAAVMTTLAEKSKFFTVLKDATIDAYYSTKEGLQTELGWDAAKPLMEFKGCTHPEHQS